MPAYVALGGLALLLAGPLPALLVRVPGLRRTPRAAMLLWQSLALAAVLAALGAGAALVTELAWDTRITGPALVGAVAAGALTLLVVVRLLWTGHRVGTRLREVRARQRGALDLLGDPRILHGRPVTVLDHDAAVAYCLPAITGHRVVVTEGALARLDDSAQRAVIAHERAHLLARHDVVLEAFTVLHRAFPRLGGSRSALTEVGLLVEVLADRAAARTAGPRPLGEALLTLAEARTPNGAMGAGGWHLAARVHLLSDARSRPLQASVLVAASVAILALPTALVVWPWLTSL